MQTDKITPESRISVDKEPDSPLAPETQEGSKGVKRIWEGLVRWGLAESALRVGASVVTISLFLIIVWVMGTFYLNQHPNSPRQAALAASLPTLTPEAPTPTLSPLPLMVDFSQGIARLAMLHTIIPSRPRDTVITYTVQKGDTLFAIAEKFNLKPESLMWGNRYTLPQPDFLSVGMTLNILPVDGAYHKWSAGEGLNGVAKFYNVSPDDIVNYPANHLSKATVGDYANPNITPGTMLVIPGGHAAFPEDPTVSISRKHPAPASLGPGACQNLPPGGLIGTGTFTWPTSWHFLSGYDYQPEINHFAIDIAGTFGNPIYAADSGVVVFAGPSQWGYGNEIVIDHGDGFQTLYAHLEDGGIYVSCGEGILKGAQIGLMGSTGNSTGPHLHFEIHSDTYGRVSPWEFFNPAWDTHTPG
jgi:murein DD-endopeptidase MepM/ murein hydrolase activator NlpD